jgi:hypothetical protein
MDSPHNALFNPYNPILECLQQKIALLLIALLISVELLFLQDKIRLRRFSASASTEDLGLWRPSQARVYATSV